MSFVDVESFLWARCGEDAVSMKLPSHDHEVADGIVVFDGQNDTVALLPYSHDLRGVECDAWQCDCRGAVAHWSGCAQ